MIATLRNQLKTNLVIVTNAGSLFSTQIVTSGLGFAYWWLAAHMYEPGLVGLSTAAVSAMLLMGDIGKVGLDTLLVGELARKPEARRALLATALLVAGLVGLALGLLFACGAPLLSSEFAPLGESAPASFLFAMGVALTSTGLVLDQALIGLLQGQIQLQRNAVFAAGKLLLLLLASLLVASSFRMLIFATWVAGSLVSFAYVAVVGLARADNRQMGYRPQMGLLRELGGASLKHYTLNLTLRVPPYVLPLLVAALISVENTASFYAAWMIADFLFTLPYAFTRVLFAVGSAQRPLLPEKMRFTLRLSFVMSAFGVVGLLFVAYPIMGLFGISYAEQATSTLRILAICVFPMIIKAHYVAVSQILGKMLQAAKIMAIGAALEIGLAAIGAHLGGLAGLSLGWVMAVCIECVMTAPTVYRIAASGKPSPATSSTSLG